MGSEQPGVARSVGVGSEPSGQSQDLREGACRSSRNRNSTSKLGFKTENSGSSGLPGVCEPQGFLTSPAQLVIPGEKEGALGYRALKGRLGLNIQT